MNKIEFKNGVVWHEAAGGFVFYRPVPGSELYVALVQKTDGSFVVPKGHLKENETPEEAAVREIKEELTMSETPRLLGKIGVTEYSFSVEGDARPHSKKLHLFAYELPSQAKLSPQREEDFIDAKWFPFDEAAKIIAFDREFLIQGKEIFCQIKN